MAVVDRIDALDKGAIFSPCRRWRYILWRTWDRSQGTCMFVGLNPSTADENTNDATVRRMVRYAMDWGYGACWVLNLFAWCATDPQEMMAAGADAIGPQNNLYLVESARQVDLVVAAWGCHGGFRRRDEEVYAMFLAGDIELHCLGLTKEAHPKHPLYLAASLRPVLYP